MEMVELLENRVLPLPPVNGGRLLLLTTSCKIYEESPSIYASPFLLNYNSCESNEMRRLSRLTVLTVNVFR
jgi:hypothetical protein